MEPILEYVHEHEKMKRFGQMMRLGENRQRKKVLLARTTDKRTRFKSTKTLDNTVAECLKQGGKPGTKNQE